MSNFKYFTWAFVVTIIGLAIAYGLGLFYGNGSHSAALSVLFIVAVLSVLEISLSFDNAIVNATYIKDMDPVWQKRFLTWGILIAVFGMRIVFPLVIVGVSAWITPWDALVLAATEPDKYKHIIESAHHSITAFGGAFLGMVGLKFFFDAEKDVHWIHSLETKLTKLGKIEAIEMALVLVVLWVCSKFVGAEHVVEYLIGGICGLIVFVMVDGLGTFLEAQEETMHGAAKAGAGTFIYLEVLDASFSFDGVIGAFALSNNLFIIAIGLGIGAMYVRSATVMLVEKNTLAHYKFLEHGAFYAIIALAAIMFINGFHEVHEVITGGIGLAFIVWSVMASIKDKKKEALSTSSSH